MNNYSPSDSFQYSLDRKNIEFIILQMVEMKKRGFDSDTRLLQKVYNWVKENKEYELERTMQAGHLITP